MRNGFKYGDYASWDFDMYVQHYPQQKTAARKLQTISVPGRNGDLHIQENSFHNYTQVYECFFHSDAPTPVQGHFIKSWLSASGAYHRLEDTYDPGHFRLATFIGPMDIDNRLNRYGVCSVCFDCDPRAFLKEGEQVVALSSGDMLYNPTAFPAKPIITVYGSGSGTLNIGTFEVEIKTISDPIILDCELQNAYSQPGEGAPVSQNSAIYAIPFPELVPGENIITFTGDITKIEIIPRWWEL